MKNVGIEHVMEVGFLDFESEWKALNSFPMDSGDDDYIFKTKQMVLMLNQVYQETKRELKGFFNINQAWILVGALNGHLYSPELPNKAVLIRKVEEGIQFNLAGEILDVDAEKLLLQLNQLTEFQAFTVIRMAYEFLYSRNKRAIDLENQNEKLLIEVFNI